MDRKLVILDLNGLLYSYDRKTHSTILRPGLNLFLKALFDKYDVAFYSSTPSRYARPILNHMLTQDQIRATTFMWFRDRVRLDHKKNDGSTIKMIDDVLSNPIINRNRIYTLLNTIIVDDSIAKLRYNPEENIVICRAYYGEDDDSQLGKLLGIIDRKFKALQ